VALRIPDLPLQRILRGRAPIDPTDAAGGARPIAVAAEGRILCADVDARAEGVRPGATIAEAVAACGRLAVVPADPAADAAALRALAEALLDLAPAVELGADALLLDASAAHLLARAAPREAEELLARRAIAVAGEMGYAARAAVATGRGPARALALHAPGPRLPGEDGRAPAAVVWVPPDGAAMALASLPVSALGLGPEVAARLAALGVDSAGALARLPEGTLAHRFGPAGVLAARLARGEDDAPLVPYVPRTLPEETVELEGPAESAEPLLFALKRLADRVAARLAGRGLGASRLRVVLKLDPRGEERLDVPLAAATATPARWLLPLKEHLFSLQLPGAVVALRLVAVEVAVVAPEQLAIGDRPEALAALEGVLARLAVRLGDGALFAAEPVDRYRPEGAYRPVPFRTGPRPRKNGEAKPRQATLATSTSASASVAEHAAAPDGRTPGSAAEEGARPTRLLAVPAPIVAEGEGGRLTALRIDGRARAVLAMEGPERLRGEWWGGPFDRDYYRVRVEGLGDCWIYRDGGNGRLWLHGFFD
jgi:protein ImuB